MCPGECAGLRLVSVIDRAILRLGQIIGTFATVTLFLSICISVVARYASYQGQMLVWINELPDLLFPWLTASGIVLAAQYGKHIIVEFGIAVVSRPLARRILIGVNLIAALTFLYLTWEGRTVLEVTSGEVFPMLRIPMVTAYSALVGAFGLLGITAVTTAIRIAVSDGNPLAVQDASDLDEDGMVEAGS